MFSTIVSVSCFCQLWLFGALGSNKTIGHFTVVCLVTWPWIGSEAGGDLVLMQTSLLFICRSCCSYAN